MKKISLLICAVLCLQAAFAQNRSIDSLKNILSHTSNPKERFAALNEILLTIDAEGLQEPDSSFIIEMLQIAQQKNDNAMLATTYNWIGYNFYRLKGDNPSALEYYFKALPLAEKTGDKRRISSICFDIGNVYTALNNIDESFNYNIRGGHNLPDRSSPMYDYMLVQYQRGLANNYMRKGQLDSALFYSQAMEQTSMRIGTKVFRFNAKTLIASIYDKMGEDELADIYFKKAKADGDSVFSESRKNVFYKNYISFLLKKGRIPEAKEQTEVFWNMANRFNNLNYLMSSAAFKREIFERSKQIDSAYYYSRMEADLNDKIFNQNNKNIIESLAFRERLRLIEENEQMAQAKEKSRQNLQYIFITIGIITLLIFYLMISHTIITNSKMIEFLGIIALLIVFEFLNLLLHPFLERVTNHNPILMLLALVLIAAMIIPLHHRAEKWATTKLVEKNKRIRLAVAKKTIEELEKGS